MEARRVIEAEDSELALDLALALHHSKEAEARLEEAPDEVAAIGDEAVESTTEDKQRVEQLRRRRGLRRRRRAKSLSRRGELWPPIRNLRGSNMASDALAKRHTSSGNCRGLALALPQARRPSADSKGLEGGVAKGATGVLNCGCLAP
ncbi:hypothetical protein BHE74_00043766 [Ensete ventricosum]|nr:hypothetical protein BHE74_00043766 [Ensete ventricosum]